MRTNSRGLYIYIYIHNIIYVYIYTNRGVEKLRGHWPCVSHLNSCIYMYHFILMKYIYTYIVGEMKQKSLWNTYVNIYVYILFIYVLYKKIMRGFC